LWPKLLTLKAAPNEAIVNAKSGSVFWDNNKDTKLKKVSPDPIVSKGFFSNAGQW